MDTGVYYDIATMLFWGISDFIQSLAIRRLGTAKTMVIRNILTLLIGLSVATVLIAQDTFVFEIKTFLIVSLSSFIYVLGYFAFARGCEIGNISLVSPIASSFAILTVLLSVIFIGEVISLTDSLYILLISQP